MTLEFEGFNNDIILDGKLIDHIFVCQDDREGTLVYRRGFRKGKRTTLGEYHMLFNNYFLPTLTFSQQENPNGYPDIVQFEADLRALLKKIEDGDIDDIYYRYPSSFFDDSCDLLYPNSLSSF